MFVDKIPKHVFLGEFFAGVGSGFLFASHEAAPVEQSHSGELFDVCREALGVCVEYCLVFLVSGLLLLLDAKSGFRQLGLESFAKKTMRNLLGLLNVFGCELWPDLCEPAFEGLLQLVGLLVWVHRLLKMSESGTLMRKDEVLAFSSVPLLHVRSCCFNIVPLFGLVVCLVLCGPRYGDVRLRPLPSFLGLLGEHMHQGACVFVVAVLVG